MEKVSASRKHPEVILLTKESANRVFSTADVLVRPLWRDGMWVNMVDKAHKVAYSFYLFETLTKEEAETMTLIEPHHIQNKANGYFTYYFRLMYPDKEKDIPKERYTARGAFHYHNEKYNKTKLDNVYIYDVNKAYLARLAKGFYPITDKELGRGFVEEDMIGYRVIGESICGLCDEGEWADVRFRKGYCQKIADFAVKKGKEMEKMKKKGQIYELAEMKLAINAMIGISRNHNVWFWEYIVDGCNKFMENLIDEDTIFCNTDSIFSLTKREDLSIGTALGQFKVEYDGVGVFYNGCNYVLYDKDGKYLDMVQMGKVKEEQDPEAFVNDTVSQKVAKYSLKTTEKGVYIV